MVKDQSLRVMAVGFSLQSREWGCLDFFCPSVLFNRVFATLIVLVFMGLMLIMMDMSRTGRGKFSISSNGQCARLWLSYIMIVLPGRLFFVLIMYSVAEISCLMALLTSFA